MRIYKDQSYNSNYNLPFDILSNGLDHFDRICFLNSNHFEGDPYSSFDWLIAMGVKSEIEAPGDFAFDLLKKFADGIDDWLFGFLCYDLKNQTEQLTSSNIDNIQMPLLHFFQPLVLITCKGGRLSLGLLENSGKWGDHDYAWNILSKESRVDPSKITNKVNIKQRVDVSKYISDISNIKDHIGRGDIYEMNYCMEFFDDNASIDPLLTYKRLNEISPSPFSAFYKIGDRHLLSTSPERFLKKTSGKIISQPIKGTIKRGNTPQEDNILKQNLYNDPKERSENVMIVDLVRNDLSKTASRGSVKVEELFGIYSFAQVNHMISTIVSQKAKNVHYVDVIKQAFPMGSMTGAPKVRAMQIIEQYESTKRGLYSGCLGYISPGKDFDFNVIIRSVLYDLKTKYLSFMVGSAITAGSDPEKEFRECLLKADSMINVFKK